MQEEVDEYQIATKGKRLLAFFIDDIVITLFLLFIFYNQLMVVSEQFRITQDTRPLVEFLKNNFWNFMLLRVLYHGFFVWYSGMTLGKQILKIKVVEMDSGMTPSLSVAFLRAIFRVVSDNIFYIGYLVAYFNPLVQTLHDKLTRTVVVDA